MPPVSPESPTLEIRLFGGFDVRVAGAPLPSLRSRREQWLLALLALHHDRDTSREWLATTLWPDNDEQQALFYLRKALSNLRKALGDESSRIITPSQKAVRLDLSGALCDVTAFGDCVRKSLFQEAVDLYRGTFLPECLEEWATAERSQREQAYIFALEQLASKSDPASAVRWLRLLVAVDPFRESAHRSLMQALADCGDRAAVTEVYRELHSVLHKELHASPSPETESLYKQLLERGEQRVASLVPSVPVDDRRHIPVPLTDLIGREKEIEEVLKLIRDRRLVTLVGSGGIGKTRLSIAVGDAAIDQFDDGVWFVDLAPLTDQSLVAQSVGRSMGIPEDRTRPMIDALLDSLHDRKLLIILDNCEHMIHACASFAHRILTSCASISILATSREPLHVLSEQTFRVPSLNVPSVQDGEDDPSQLMAFDAIRLFVDRASRIDKAFRLTQRNAPDIAEICRQLDGIALAIEMAAARLRSMSIGEIRSRLVDRFKLLTGGNRAALPRQHTLRAAIDWSYDQLSEPERMLLRRLSAFSGGWNLEAAEAVSGQDDTFDLLTSLADKSLVVIETQEDRTRYTMLETVRQYGAYRMAEAEEKTKIGAKHRDYFLSIAEEAEKELRGAKQSEMKAILEEEIENLRTAMTFSLETNDTEEKGLRIGRSLWIFWADQGYVREGIETLEKLLAKYKEATHVRADALNGLGVLYFLRSDYPLSRARHEESMEISRSLHYKKGLANAFNGLGNSATDLADYENAKKYYSESLAIQREIGNTPGMIASITNLGRIANQQGDNKAARELQEQALDICRRAGDSIGVSRSLIHLGMIAFYESDFQKALALAEESLALRRELAHLQGVADSLNVVAMSAFYLGDKKRARELQEENLSIQKSLGSQWGIGAAYVNLGSIVQSEGELSYAKQLFRDAIELFNSLGDTRGLTEGLHGLASVAREEGRDEYAAKLWGSGLGLREANKSVVPGPEAEILEKEIGLARERLGAKKFQTAFDWGHDSPLNEVVALALNG